ncbi:hypothetical protein CHUAL_013938 [Chamberlinius hualienensis]
MLDLEVFPERSISNDQLELVLGMTFAQVVQVLQQHAKILKGLQIQYSDLNPLAMDFVINLTQDGIRLIFDPVVQRLKVIEVYNMSKVKLKYCAVPFNTPEISPTVEKIDLTFGATHPGVYDETQQAFALNFRGISFSFPVDSKFQPHSTTALGSRPFPAGASPVVSKMSIYGGNNLAETKAPPLPLCCYYNYAYLDHLDVIRDNNTTLGLKLYLNVEGIGSTSMFEMTKQLLVREIKFGNSCQEITSALGSPSKIFYKAEDKMKIHSPSAHKLVVTRSSDYFYNYFTLGLDVLFDSKTHTATKFILHTNYPGHYNFNMYYRCHFKIVLPPEKVVSVDVTDKPSHVITSFSKWDTISDMLYNQKTVLPVVLTRASSTNTTNIFGPTCCYGFQDMIFEVMSNNHIASVTLYNSRNMGIRDVDR